VRLKYCGYYRILTSIDIAKKARIAQPSLYGALVVVTGKYKKE